MNKKRPASDACGPLEFSCLLSSSGGSGSGGFDWCCGEVYAAHRPDVCFVIIVGCEVNSLFAANYCPCWCPVASGIFGDADFVCAIGVDYIDVVAFRSRFNIAAAGVDREGDSSSVG